MRTGRIRDLEQKRLTGFEREIEMSAPTTTIHHVSKIRIGQQRMTKRGGFFREVYIYSEDYRDPVLELALFGDEPLRIEEEAGVREVTPAA